MGFLQYFHCPVSMGGLLVYFLLKFCSSLSVTLVFASLALVRSCYGCLLDFTILNQQGSLL